ncbi:MAG: hypothetical protein KBD63_03585 [Bacteriovoracaceae bacterium]|nr:hypothetical protein [Bacteriovoracaceae bacterium]
MDKACEISAIKIKPDGSVDVFTSLINPERDIPELAESIHGITAEMVANAPTLANLLPHFLTFCENLPLVAHNAAFDLGFLVYGMHEEKLPWTTSAVYDSCRLARQVLSKKNLPPKNFKLSTLCDFFEIKMEKHHRAYDDALACLKVVSRLPWVCDMKKETARIKSYLFRLTDFSELKNFSLPSEFSFLAQEVRLRNPVEIEYKGGSVKETFRPLVPNGILPLPQGLILQGICLLSNNVKSFSLKKIKSVRPFGPKEYAKWERELVIIREKNKPDLLTMEI